MPCLNEIESAERVGLETLWKSWQTRIENDFKRLNMNKQNKLKLLLKGSEILDLNNISLFIKRTQFEILEKRCVDGTSEANARLLIKSFMHISHGFSYLETEPLTCRSLIDLCECLVKATFRLAVCIHKNTNIACSSSIGLPPTFYVESNETCGLIDIDTVAEYISLLSFYLTRKLESLTFLSHQVKARMLIYKRLLIILSRLVECCSRMRDSATMNTMDETQIYIRTAFEHVKLIREYLFQSFKICA